MFFDPVQALIENENEYLCKGIRSGKTVDRVRQSFLRSQFKKRALPKSTIWNVLNKLKIDIQGFESDTCVDVLIETDKQLHALSSV